MKKLDKAPVEIVMPEVKPDSVREYREIAVFSTPQRVRTRPSGKSRVTPRRNKKGRA